MNRRRLCASMRFGGFVCVCVWVWHFVFIAVGEFTVLLAERFGCDWRLVLTSLLSVIGLVSGTIFWWFRIKEDGAENLRRFPE